MQFVSVLYLVELVTVYTVVTRISVTCDLPFLCTTILLFRFREVACIFLSQFIISVCSFAELGTSASRDVLCILCLVMLLSFLNKAMFRLQIFAIWTL